MIYTQRERESNANSGVKRDTFKNFRATPAWYPWTMQFGEHLDILQIVYKLNMQCPKLAYHLAQGGICKVTYKIKKKNINT